MARKQARRRNDAAGSGSFLSFGAGLVTGLLLASLDWVAGWIPGGGTELPGLQPSGRDEPPIAEHPDERPGRRYDFFTVLPEREVVVPREEIAERARQRDNASAERGPYQLQVGSFRASQDAEALRAQLVLLGLSASLQSVTVDDETWHRVRVGPFDSARDADAARRRLQENGFDAMVLRGG